MSYKLNKPYTNFERADFIVTHQGLECVETNDALFLLEQNEIWNDEKQAPVINGNYEKERVEKLEKEFNKEFFNSSLGYIRRIVHMLNSDTKSFLTDILPLLQVGIPIITYNKPDFKTKEKPTQNLNVLITEEFLQECKNQLLVDFYGSLKAETNKDNND